MENKTIIKVLPNSWIRLEEYTSGYACVLKTFLMAGNVGRTIYIDNSSINPISIHNYTVDDLLTEGIKPDWDNVVGNVIRYFNSYQEGMHFLKSILPDAFYQDVYRTLRDHICHEDNEYMEKEYGVYR